jgi:hypothetical protein
MPRQVFDKTVQVKQVSVVEAHGLLIFRVDKGKDGKMNVFRLTDFEGEAYEYVTRTRTDCREHRLERAKGASTSFIYLFFFIFFLHFVTSLPINCKSTGESTEANEVASTLETRRWEEVKNKALSTHLIC